MLGLYLNSSTSALAARYDTPNQEKGTTVTFRSTLGPAALALGLALIGGLSNVPMMPLI